MPGTERDFGRAESLAALALYAGASLALFGWPILPHLSSTLVGWGTDPASHAWFLAWWPHALTSWVDPFHSRAVWAPSGYNLAGSTGVPGPSLILAPITTTLGPVVAYNLFSLAAPAVSAWTAYLLCRRLTGGHWPSLVGGFLFGFSTYELGQLAGHPNLSMVAAVPVAVLLVLKRTEGSLRPKPFVGLLALVLLLQFLTSTEVFLTMTLFGGLALLVALATLGQPTRATLWRLIPQIGLAYVLAAIPLVPYLYNVVRSASHSPIYAFYPSFYSTDLVNFAVPTQLSWVGRARFADVAATFSGTITEQAGYLGIPLLGAVFLFAFERWRERASRYLLALLGLFCLATLGPTLRVRGAETIPLPWAPFTHIPLVKYALPSRFMLYVSLVVGVMVALWLSGPGGPAIRAVRWGVVAVGVASLLPNLSGPYWQSAVDTPAFFLSGLYRTHLRPGENVLIIPYGDRGNSMLWQAQADFYFRMAEGYVSVVPPPEFSRWPILQTLYDGTLHEGSGEELRAFLADKGIETVILAGDPGPWPGLLSSVGLTATSVGGVALYPVPRSVLATPPGAG